MVNKVEKVMCGAGDQRIACGGALALGGVARNSDLQSNATLSGSRKMNNMKKLMIVAAAALCAGVGYSESSLTSSNVVGYQNKQTSNFAFVGPDFINCNGSEEFTLGDLKFNCDEESLSPASGWKPNSDMINILNTDKGENVMTLVYINEAWATAYTDSEEYGTVTKGWYNVDDVEDDFSVKYDQYPITFGTALQVNAASGNEDIGILFSGAVKKDPTITDIDGFMAVANCSPQLITLGDLKFNCNEKELSPTEGWKPNSDVINILNAEKGENILTLVYINEAWATAYTDSEEYGTVTKGWYNIDDVEDDFSVKYDSYKIPAGSGIQVNAQDGAKRDVTVQVNPAL